MINLICNTLFVLSMLAFVLIATAHCFFTNEDQD